MGKRTSGAVETFRPSFSGKKNVMIESILHQSIPTICSETLYSRNLTVTGLAGKRTSGVVETFKPSSF